ncbi:MAG: hypothetical protein WC391_10050 [Methanoregula sp.]
MSSHPGPPYMRLIMVMIPLILCTGPVLESLRAEIQRIDQHLETLEKKMH